MESGARIAAILPSSPAAPRSRGRPPPRRKPDGWPACADRAQAPALHVPETGSDGVPRHQAGGGIAAWRARREGLERFAERLNRGFPWIVKCDSSFPLGGGQHGMGKPYSEDLRRGVVQAIAAGHTYEEVAGLCGVSVSSISRFLTRWRRSGSVSPAKFGGYKGYALEGHEKRITRWIATRPDITLSELQARLAKEKVVVSQTAIFRFLRHLDFTFKKKPARGRTRPGGRRRGA